jgi:hypothetical protein
MIPRPLYCAEIPLQPQYRELTIPERHHCAEVRPRQPPQQATIPVLRFCAGVRPPQVRLQISRSRWQIHRARGPVSLLTTSVG